jgi:Bacterial type II and III secretion system protein
MHFLRNRAAVAIALVVLVLPLAAVATQNKGSDDRSEERDGHSRHEDGRLTYIPLPEAAGGGRIARLIVVQTRFIHVAETSFGVDFKSFDRLDVSEVPLLGSLFDERLSADDLTEDNRVGSVYLAGDGNLTAVIDDRLAVGEQTLEVVTGPGLYEIQMTPRLVETAPTELGDFGALPSVESLLAGQAPPETTIVLAGLTKTAVPEVETKVPVLGDVPILQELFRGTAHRGDDDNLIIFLRPSIIAGDDDY